MFVEMGLRAELVANQSNYYSTLKKIKYIEDKTLYKDKFEKQFFNQTQTFYNKQSNILIQQQSTK